VSAETRSGAGPQRDVHRTAAIRSVVCDVLIEAVRSAGADGIVVLDDWTDDGELTYEWLTGAMGESRIWRGAALASNVHGTELERSDAQMLGAWRLARERSVLLAHPASKTALLLGGALPRADVFPLGDLYASQVAELADGVSIPDEVAALARRAGGIERLDAALGRLVDARMPPAAALDVLERDVANELLQLYARGRYSRMRPRLVPKLSARTLGTDLFD
jgi:hypothetical protein